MISRRHFIQYLASSAALGLTSQAFAQEEIEARPNINCPVLMYHYISEAPEDSPRSLVDLTVPPEDFAAHLDVLQADGFTTVSMEQVYLAWYGEASLPEKPIVISFDDGYWDAYAHATRLLLERGMRGTFYLITSLMDQAGYLTWGQAAEMRAAGMEIGNHSLTHPDLSRLSANEQRIELEQSTAAIESILGFRPTAFCYPFGRQNLNTRLILSELGYHSGVTTRDGTILYRSNPYRLSRVRVRYGTTPSELLWFANRRV